MKSATLYELFNQQRPGGGLRRRLTPGTPLVIAPGAVLTVLADTDDDGRQTAFWNIRTREWSEVARFDEHQAINAASLGWHIFPLAREYRGGRLVALHLYFHAVGAAGQAVQP